MQIQVAYMFFFYRRCYKVSIPQYKINEIYTIIKQKLLAQSQNLYKKTYKVQKKNKNWREKIKREGKDNYYNTSSIFNLT